MEISLTVFAKNAETEEQMASELQSAVGQLATLNFLRAPELGQIILVDEDYPALLDFLAEMERSGSRRGRAVFLVLPDIGEAPEEFLTGRVDDVLVRPFRSLEVLSKIRHCQHILMWDEIHEINASFSGMIDQLRGDLKLAERLQKSKLPLRFPEVRGFKISHRYLAGLRAGGDHLDLAESKDGQQLSLVLSDSSSYGLSSAVLSALMRVMVRLSAEESRSCAETVRRIQDELRATLTDRDRLSLFYGVVSRKDYRLRFVNLGSSSAFYASPKKGFALLGSQGPQISAKTGVGGGAEAGLGAGTGAGLACEGEILLEPDGRLALISDGFVEAAGGMERTRELLDQFRGRESADAINELVFRVKERFREEDDLPGQDCTAAIFDLDARLIRLA